MRRPIIQKTQNCQLLLETSISHHLEEIQKSSRPGTSFKPPEAITESHLIQTDDSNQSISSFRKSQLIYLESLGTHKEDFQTKTSFKVNTSKTSKKSRYYTIENISTKIKKSKNLELSIQGRPLTASSIYPESRKTPQIFSIKKRSSVFSYGDSDLITPLDPKFIDEYIGTEDYSKLIRYPPSKNSIGILANTNNYNENRIMSDYHNSYSPSPELKSYSKTADKRMGLIVTTPYAAVRPIRVSFNKRGKIAKGLSNKPPSIKRPKLVHNIVVSS